MNDNKGTYLSGNTLSQEALRELSGEYFDGTISPERMAQLREAAGQLDDKLSGIVDASLRADLTAIRMLDGYVEVTIKGLEQRVPDDLEQRLDSHISRLARASRIRGLWIKGGSAAACVALLVTAAIRFTGHQETLPHPPTMSIAEAVATETPSATHIEPIQLPTSPAEIPATAKHGAEKPAQSKKPVYAKQQSAKRPAITVTVAEATVPGLTGNVVIPEQIAYVEKRLPDIAAAREEVSDLISTPFATISATLENIKQSLDMVNATFYQANKTVTALSETLLVSAAAPLQDI